MASPLSVDEDRHRVMMTSPDVAVGSWRNVLIAEWRLRTTAAQVDDIRFRLETLARVHPTGVFYLALVRDTASPPDDRARRALAQILRNEAGVLLGGAVAFDGSGFRCAFVRSVATSLVMLARPAFPFNVCSLDEAADEFADRSSSHRIAFERTRFLSEVKAFRMAVSV
jgi:hypothetical protein